MIPIRRRIFGKKEGKQMDQQLIAALNELSQKAKEQKIYEDRIAKLEKKRSQTTFHAKSVHVEEKPAHQAQDILDRSFKKTESTIKAIKVLVWIVVVAAIILSGIGVVKQLLQGDDQMLGMFIASFVGAGISAFCFRRISNGDGGCISWIFGIGSATLRASKKDYRERVVYYEESSAYDSSVIDIEIG
jgi:hypothetical protein